MYGAEAGQVAAGLSERHGAARVGVDPSVDAGEIQEQAAVRRRVGGRPQPALDDSALVIEDDHVIGGELVIVHSARLDGERAASGIGDGDISEGQVDEAGFRQREVRREALLREGGVGHEACGGSVSN